MKKLVLSFMILALVLVLVACGKSTSPQGKNQAGGGETQASSSDVIVISNLQDLSSTTSVWGKMVTNGAQLAIDKINKEGSINGKKLKLVTYDTKNDVQEAIKYTYYRRPGFRPALRQPGRGCRQRYLFPQQYCR
ncbi:ABC transporter substrate-binding protein [Neomoorella glycerini]|uniref:ABC transporter substrate-binding protein n=1 Tax=Neomoorella glycerini TaxID=55779 RepID=UPI001FEC56AD|nr:ABC transporter substrate-binding protein [Moorella glycerini]